MPTSTGSARGLLWGAVALVLAAGLVAAGAALAARAEAGHVWLGAPLAERVADRLKPATPASTDANFLFAAYQPTKTLRSWRIVSAQAENAFPLWQNLLDDDPVYGLTVDLDVEYANGQRARLRWTTWHYGVVLGPVVIGYGTGEPGRLTRLAEAGAP